MLEIVSVKIKEIGSLPILLIVDNQTIMMDNLMPDAIGLHQWTATNCLQANSVSTARIKLNNVRACL